MKRDFLSMDDISMHEMVLLFRMAKALKKRPVQPMLRHKNLVLLFQKPSTRTMVSFEAGMNQLGGQAIHLNWNDIQLGRGETIADTARVLSRYADGIMARLYAHRDIEELARNADVPVINGLTDLSHPCQALSDMFTIAERFKRLSGLKMCFIGDGRDNVCYSLMQACHKAGMHMAIACPKGYEPGRQILSQTCKHVAVYDSPKPALKEADVVYTDTWISMGEEKERAQRLKDLSPYQLNSAKLRLAKPGAVVMHCLPAHRGQEITAEVMDGPQSIVWDQAGNRLHVQKALLAMMM